MNCGCHLKLESTPHKSFHPYNVRTMNDNLSLESTQDIKIVQDVDAVYWTLSLWVDTWVRG